MATVGNISPEKPDPFECVSLSSLFNETNQPVLSIVETYHRLLREDPELTMPVAAIEALILFLHHSRATTVFETLNLLAMQSSYLKSKVPNPISLSAGTDLFQRYMISSLGASGEASFETIRQHLLSNGRLFVTRAKESRERIAANGRHFVRDGCTVLTHGGSRVVGTLLTKAAEMNISGSSVRFKVIYVMNGVRVPESKAVVSSLRAKGVPVATISEGAVGYAMGSVDLVIVGAEGVVENGGIISRLGTYQIGILAKAAGKPFHVVAESHKFVRLYPLGQYDLPIDQKVIEFKTSEDEELTEQTPRGKNMKEYFDDKTPVEPVPPNAVIDAVDYTVSQKPLYQTTLH
jgi:translation initiation factor eIF-2B subunit alpha